MSKQHEYLMHPLRLWRAVRYAVYGSLGEWLEARADRLFRKQWYS